MGHGARKEAVPAAEEVGGGVSHVCVGWCGGRCLSGVQYTNQHRRPVQTKQYECSITISVSVSVLSV